ncbi:hypothetical protein JCM30237_12410 [Halolamina litorea]|uniref:Uncharacterized protein n=1 Tax=Halolamina litorea TaxID=1515593 RepID=A0ABD6BN22_9EURY|nr:hypothetical protein [Halolamina litorea]
MGLFTLGKIERLRGVVDRAGDFRPAANADLQEKIRDFLGNRDGLTQFVYSTDGTAAEALDSKSVPGGVEALVEYQQGNDGVVFLGDENGQEIALTATGQGRSFRVSDTSVIYVRTPTAGDSVVVTFEGGA